MSFTTYKFFLGEEGSKERGKEEESRGGPDFTVMVAALLYAACGVAVPQH